MITLFRHGVSFALLRIKGAQGSVFVFAVPGTVNPRRILPESQQDPEAFQANSNVLDQAFDF